MVEEDAEEEKEGERATQVSCISGGRSLICLP